MYFADAWMGERADRNFPSRTKDFWAFEQPQHLSSPSFLFYTGNRHRYSAPTEPHRPSSHGGSDAVAEADSLRRRTALSHPRLVPGALSSILSSLFIRPNTRSASGNAHVEFRPFPPAQAFTKAHNVRPPKTPSTGGDAFAMFAGSIPGRNVLTTQRSNSCVGSPCRCIPAQRFVIVRLFEWSAEESRLSFSHGLGKTLSSNISCFRPPHSGEMEHVRHAQDFAVDYSQAHASRLPTNQLLISSSCVLSFAAFVRNT
ncbi:hypothetical protein EJ07DRAFT_155214 [Lizonia empirigonia]|nr:hypothetical protein EJ07DRAFT_155214 [Lizonia empirigonia]